MQKNYAAAVIPLRTKVFYLLIGLFVVGIGFGVWAFSNDEAGLLFKALADGYTDAQTAVSAADNFFLTVSADAVFLGAVFLLGFSAVSVPLLLLVPFFKGLGIGAAACALYVCDPSPAALLKCFVGFSLTSAVSSFVIIFAVLSALRLSAGMFCHLRGRCEDFALQSEAKKCGLKFLLFSVIIVVNAVVDTLLSMLLF